MNTSFRKLLQLNKIQKLKVYLFILNTVGGDVEAGLAISEMMATLSKPTVSLVLGGGHSIGVPIAVSLIIHLLPKQRR